MMNIAFDVKVCLKMYWRIELCFGFFNERQNVFSWGSMSS